MVSPLLGVIQKMTNVESPAQSPALLSDSYIAGMLGVSRSWVRKERFNRRHKKLHSFTVDPVHVGSLPRYRREDVEAWIASLTHSMGTVRTQ